MIKKELFVFLIFLSLSYSAKYDKIGEVFSSVFLNPYNA